MANTNLPESVVSSFQNHAFTSAENKALEKMYAPVARAVEKSLRRHWELPAVTREDIVAKALVSGLAYCLAANGAIPRDDGEWAALACWKARNLALDEVRARMRDPLVLTLVAGNDMGEAFAEPPALVRRSFDHWRETLFRDEYDTLVDQTRDALRAFLADHFGPRMARIFWARAMDGWSTEDVMHAFHISADVVYVTVCRVKKAWARRGREYFRAA